MKFGKTYMEALASPAFPEEWRKGAIEYKQLKKLINGVVAELESIGLGADVLRDLINGADPAEVGANGGGSGGVTAVDDDDENADDEDEKSAGYVGGASGSEQEGATSPERRRKSDASNASSGRSRRRSSTTAPAKSASGTGTDSAASSEGEESGVPKLSRGASSLATQTLSPLPEDRVHASRGRGDNVAAPPMALPLGAEALGHGKAADTHGGTPAQEWITHIAHSQHHHDARKPMSRSRSGSRDPTDTEGGSKGEAEPASRTAPPATAPQGDDAPVEILRPTLVFDQELKAAKQRQSSAPRTLGKSATDKRDGRTPARRSGSGGVQPLSTATATSEYALDKRELESLRRRRSLRGGADQQPLLLPASAYTEVRRKSTGGAVASLDAGPDAAAAAAAVAAVDMERQAHGANPDETNGATTAERGQTHVGEDGLEEIQRPARARHHPEGRWVQGKDGRRARAEYELAGTPEHPEPRIRLFVESPINSDDEESEDENDEDVEDEDHRPAHRPQNLGAHIWELPESPRIVGTKPPSKLEKATLGERLGAAALDDKEPGKSSNGTASSSSSGHRTGITSEPPTSRPRRFRTRQILIPLTADFEFLNTLTDALSNLSDIQHQQAEKFVAHTDSLAQTVARVASPFASTNDLYVWREIFTLYVEMQIFESEREKDRGELSVEESEARFKRFVEELAKRGWTAEASKVSGAKGRAGLKRLGGRLARRPHLFHHHHGHAADGSGSETTTTGLPMKDPRSVEALEDFLRLNMELLDIKKFQRVNVEAARKILKKHDKRTALTASGDLRSFLAQRAAMSSTPRQEGGAAGLGGDAASVKPTPATWAPPKLAQAPSSPSGALVAIGHGETHPGLAALIPSGATALLSNSLPHILVSLLTTTLLPILPSIDDYSCAICTSVAWRPVRLGCGHLFCIRCLVKLQKQRKSDCPMCRSKNAVGSADERNLEEALNRFLSMWFPREVSEKQRENEKERRREEMLELGQSVVDGPQPCVVA